MSLLLIGNPQPNGHQRLLAATNLSRRILRPKTVIGRGNNFNFDSVPSHRLSRCIDERGRRHDQLGPLIGSDVWILNALARTELKPAPGEPQDDARHSQQPGGREDDYGVF